MPTSVIHNASGSALLFEIYRTIKALIEKKEIDHPERTIRFLWVPEFSGTIPWIVEQEKRENFKPIFCINLDMVGEHPSLVGFPFTVNKTSISTPSFLNDLISECIENVKDNPLIIEQGGWQFPWNYRIKPFAGGSDHLLFNDAPLRIPSVMFGHPDTFHHTNLDTIEKVDPTTLKRVGAVATSTIISCCYKDKFSEEMQGIFLKGLEKRKGSFLNMILKEIKLVNNLGKEEKEEKEYLIQYVHLPYLKYERRGLQSIEDLFGSLNTEISDLQRNGLNHFESSILTLTRELAGVIISKTTQQLLDKIPKRLWKGPFNANIIYKSMSNLDSLKDELKLSENQIMNIKELSQSMMANYGGLMFDTINLIDDERSVLEIALYLSLVEWKIIDIKIVGSFIELMEKLEVISF
ncbi:MAG: M28 family peptidase [Candidatus Heimdallarchaeaceae archaeon]